MTGSERCLIAILAAANNESSQDRLRVAIQCAIDDFQNEATKIADISARKGALIDLKSLVEASRRDRRGLPIERTQAQALALGFAEPLVKDLVAWFDTSSTFENKS